MYGRCFNSQSDFRNSTTEDFSGFCEDPVMFVLQVLIVIIILIVLYHCVFTCYQKDA